MNNPQERDLNEVTRCLNKYEGITLVFDCAQERNRFITYVNKLVYLKFCWNNMIIEGSNGKTFRVLVARTPENIKGLTNYLVPSETMTSRNIIREVSQHSACVKAMGKAQETIIEPAIGQVWRHKERLEEAEVKDFNNVWVDVKFHGGGEIRLNRRNFEKLYECIFVPEETHGKDDITETMKEPKPDLPLEVFNDEKPDPKKVWDEIKRSSRGY